jgi:hypothetical protein
VGFDLPWPDGSVWTPFLQDLSAALGPVQFFCAQPYEQDQETIRPAHYPAQLRATEITLIPVGNITYAL